MGSLFSGKHRLLALYLLVPTGEPQKPPPYVCSLPGSNHSETGHWMAIYHEGVGWGRKGSFASYQTDTQLWPRCRSPVGSCSEAE